MSPMSSSLITENEALSFVMKHLPFFFFPNALTIIFSDNIGNVEMYKKYFPSF